MRPEPEFDDITSEQAVALLGGDAAAVREEVVLLLQSMIRNRCENRGDGLCKASAVCLHHHLP
jgi:hypothetical protein